MRWDSAMVLHMQNLRREGHSLSQVGRRLGVSKNAVASKSRRLSLPKRTRVPRSVRFDRTMLWVTVRLYEIGETLTVIAKRVGVSEPLIMRKLVENGYAPRGYTGHPSRYQRRTGLSWVMQATDCDPLDFVAVDDAP